MKRWMQVLAGCACVALAGCSRGVDKEMVEQTVQAELNARVQEKGIKGTCTQVELMQESDTKFVGYATFSDGSKRNVDAVVDPNTGDIMF